MTMQSKKQFKNQSQTEYMQSNEPQITGREAGKQNRTKIHSQDGRSMVEMLGVLAIIAILSIGGIVGYKLAMNYYQADQIANEINLMRNDFKVKYALGNEELLLGNPYDETPEDENYSGHLSTQYDRYPVDYDCIRKDKAEFYNCRETDAYYIKVGNISKGVCKPLTTLLNGMDGLMYIEINKQPYTEDDLCSSDEANEIYIEFDAEDVNGNYDSNRPEGWCAKDEDCEEPQVCNEENNTCVECTENADCPINKPVCNVEQGNCESCPPETPVWYNNKCVECTTSADCENPKPYCNPTTNTCEPCENDSQCDTAQKEHCKTSTGECVVCEDGSEWDEETKECMSCTERECTDNDDCCENYFCRKGLAPLPDGDNIVEINKTAHSNSRGTCEPLGEVKPISLNGKPLFGSDKFIIWWDACRWCEALHGQSGSQCDSNAYESNYMVGIEEIDWQCPGYGNFSAPQREVYCCYADGAEKNPQVSSSYHNELVCDVSKEKSSTIKRLRELYSDQDVYIWFKNYFRGADSWRIAFANLYQGYISNNGGARYDDKNAGRARTICK